MLQELIGDYDKGDISCKALVNILRELAEEGFDLSKPLSKDHKNFVSQRGVITHNKVLKCYNCEKEITVADLHLFAEMCVDCYEAEYGSFRFDPYNCGICGGDPEDCDYYCDDEED